MVRFLLRPEMPLSPPATVRFGALVFTALATCSCASTNVDPNEAADASSNEEARLAVPDGATIVVDVYRASLVGTACTDREARYTLRPDRTLMAVTCEPPAADAGAGGEGVDVTTKELQLTEDAYAALLAKVRAVSLGRSTATDSPQLAFEIETNGTVARYCSESTPSRLCEGQEVSFVLEPMYAFYAAASGAQP